MAEVVLAQDGLVALASGQDGLAALVSAQDGLAAWGLVAWELVAWGLAGIVVDQHFLPVLVVGQDLLVEKDCIGLVVGLKVEQVVVPVSGLDEELELVLLVVLVP